MPSEMLGRGGCTQTGQRPRESGQGWVGCSGARKAGMSWCWGGHAGGRGLGKVSCQREADVRPQSAFPPSDAEAQLLCALRVKSGEKQSESISHSVGSDTARPRGL